VLFKVRVADIAGFMYCFNGQCMVWTYDSNDLPPLPLDLIARSFVIWVVELIRSLFQRVFSIKPRKDCRAEFYLCEGRVRRPKLCILRRVGFREQSCEFCTAEAQEFCLSYTGFDVVGDEILATRVQEPSAASR